MYICICNGATSDLQINDHHHHLQPRRIMYLYMYVYVHKYVCAYMHVYKHVHVCIYKNQMPNHQIISYYLPGRICVWLMLCSTNNVSYFASLVHMDYECLTCLDYFSPVVITYAMHVLCTCVYVHIY